MLTALAIVFGVLELLTLRKMLRTARGRRILANLAIGSLVVAGVWCAALMTYAYGSLA